MMLKKKWIPVVMALVCGAVFFFSSCKKEDDSYKVKVYIIDEAGMAVDSARVRIFAPVPGTLVDYTDSTNSSGLVKFEYDNEAVLQIESTKGNPFILKGCGFVKLKKGKEVTKTVIMTSASTSPC